MAIALNIRADNDTADAIERLWDHVSAFEDTPSMRALGYRTHFTFAIYDPPDIDEATAWAAMQNAARDEGALQIRFSRIRWFDGPPLVLWLEPSEDRALSKLHASISAAIDPACCRPHYRPGAWVPHCTLGMRIADNRRADAIAFARMFKGHLDVLFDVVDCVTSPPVRIVAQRRLPSGAA